MMTLSSQVHYICLRFYKGFWVFQVIVELWIWEVNAYTNGCFEWGFCPLHGNLKWATKTITIRVLRDATIYKPKGHHL
jgi:hypothetical protein